MKLNAYLTKLLQLTKHHAAAQEHARQLKQFIMPLMPEVTRGK